MLSINVALIQHLKEMKVHHSVNTDGNKISHLFIAYLESIQLALNNQDMVLFDDKYKPNKYYTPLLHMVSNLSDLITQRW